MVLPFVIFHITGSAMAVSVSFLLETLPIILLAPITSYMVDNHARKNILLCCELVSAAAILLCILTNCSNIYVLYLACSILAYFIGILTPYFMGKLMDSVQSAGSVKVKLIVTILVLLVVGFACNWTQNYFWFKMIYQGNYLLRKALFQKVMSHKPSFSLNHSNGDMVNRLINDCGQYAEKVLIATPMLLVNSCTLLMIFGIVASLNVVIALILLAVSVLYFAIYINMNGKLRHYATKQSESFSQMLDNATNFYNGIPTIKRYGQEAYFTEKYGNKVKQHYTQCCNLQRWKSLALTFSSFIIGLLPVITIVVGIYYISVGKCTVGMVFTMFSYTSYLTEPIQNLTDFNLVLQQSKAMEQRLEVLLPQLPTTSYLAGSIASADFLLCFR